MSHTENLTIMFTDIADYSKSVAKMSRKQSEEMLKAHDQILHKIIKLYKGRWIKSIGDSFLVVFRSPTDAALCGMAMHDALWELAESIDEESKQIRIRVSLNLGEVRLTRKDVFGEAVNIAARLEGVTPADSIYLTESVYLSMNKAEVLAVKVGSERFKGSSEEIVYYEIPRSVSRRVVADESDFDKPYFDYPYGGAHLKAGAIETAMKADLLAPIHGIGGLAKVGMGLGLLSIVAMGLFFSMRPNMPVDVVTEQSGGTIFTEQINKTEAIVETEVPDEAPDEVLPLSSVQPSGETSFQSELEPLSISEPNTENESSNVFDSLKSEPLDESSLEIASIDIGEPEIGAAKIETSSESAKNTYIRGEVNLLLEEEDIAGLQLLADEYSGTNPESPYLYIIQGHLLSLSSEYREAIETYQSGLEVDSSLAADEYLADRLMVLLDYQPTKTRALLREYSSPEIVDRLSERTGQSGMQSRHYAVTLLDKSDNADRIDSVGMNIWDLRELEKCKEKKIAVVALRKLGDPAALPALKEAIEGKFFEKIRYSCLFKEAKSAISEIEATAS